LAKFLSFVYKEYIQSRKNIETGSINKGEAVILVLQGYPWEFTGLTNLNRTRVPRRMNRAYYRDVYKYFKIISSTLDS
jgi:hypothetical protein